MSKPIPQEMISKNATIEYDVCAECIDDEYLKALIEWPPDQKGCSFCSSGAKSISIEELAEVVDSYLRKFTKKSTEEYSSFFASDEDYTEIVHNGTELEMFLQEELDIEYEIAIQLLKSLEKRCLSEIMDTGTAFYDSERNYIRESIPGDEYRWDFIDFTHRLKHTRRFYDEYSINVLEKIFGIIGSKEAEDIPIIFAGEGEEIETVYRARSASSPENYKKFQKKPDTNLCAPPPRKASAGRMNAYGIPVFYGSLAEETAISEIRPNVGALVVVGQYKIKKRLKILDLPKLGKTITGSIFNPDYENRAARFSFLEKFHAIITQPITPAEEDLGYLSTQAISEYIFGTLKFDGVLYASTQSGGVNTLTDSDYFTSESLETRRIEANNLVLFMPQNYGIPSEDEDYYDLWLGEDGILEFVEYSEKGISISKVKYSWDRAEIY